MNSAGMREAALKATRGPWEVKELNVPIGDSGDYDGSIAVLASALGTPKLPIVVFEMYSPTMDDCDNFKFAALCFPERILNLLDVYDAAVKARDAMEASGGWDGDEEVFKALNDALRKDME